MKMNANDVYNETVSDLSKYSDEALYQLAYYYFNVKSSGKTSDEVIQECALIEANNYSK